MVKDWFKNFFTTTAVTLLLITLIGIATGDGEVKIISIVWATAANLVIHLGLIPIRRFSSPYYLVDMAVEFGWVMGVILLAGLVSGWFATTPVWMTVGITAAVFAVACLVDVVRIRKDLEEINAEIRVRQRGEEA